MTERHDIEDELVRWIMATWPAVKAGTVTDSALESKMPFIRVTHYGGPREDVTDYPRLSLDSFAATRSKAKEVLETVADSLLPRTRLMSATIDTVRIDASPHRLPWDNTRVVHFGMTCQISLRR